MPRRRFALRPRTLAALVVVLLLVNAGVLAAAHHFTRSGSSDQTIRRTDPVADLLGWLPDSLETRRSFAVWAGSGYPSRLGMTPTPLTLGSSSGWTPRYGWDASQVTAWAAAGSGSSVAILEGSFDWALIERTLKTAGFKESTYRRAALFTATTPGPSDDVILNGDSSSVAKAVALLDGRIVTGASAALVKSAIDTAEGRTGSLAAVPAIAAALPSLAPLTGLMAISQADQAIACGVGRGWTGAQVTPAEDRYVIVAYGHLGAGGEPRTLVALTFGSESAASAALPAYSDGWTEGFANAGGLGGSIAAFGNVTNVSQNHAMVVAEITGGTEQGWARAGLRFAIAVCSPASDALPPGTPVPAASPSATPGEAS